MKGKVGAVFLGFLIVVGLILCAMSAKRIPAGYVVLSTT